MMVSTAGGFIRRSSGDPGRGGKPIVGREADADPPGDDRSGEEWGEEPTGGSAEEKESGKARSGSGNEGGAKLSFPSEQQRKESGEKRSFFETGSWPWGRSRRGRLELISVGSRRDSGGRVEAVVPVVDASAVGALTSGRSGDLYSRLSKRSLLARSG